MFLKKLYPCPLIVAEDPYVCSSHLQPSSLAWGTHSGLCHQNPWNPVQSVPRQPCRLPPLLSLHFQTQSVVPSCLLPMLPQMPGGQGGVLPASQNLYRENSLGDVSESEHVSQDPSAPRQFIILLSTSFSCAAVQLSQPRADFVCQPSGTKVPRCQTNTILHVSMKGKLWMRLISKLRDFQ